MSRRWRGRWILRSLVLTVSKWLDTVVTYGSSFVIILHGLDFYDVQSNVYGYACITRHRTRKYARLTKMENAKRYTDNMVQ